MTRSASLRLYAVAAFVAALFVALFTFGYHGRMDFWMGITTVAFLAASLAFVADPGYHVRLRKAVRGGLLRETGIGLLSALLLFGIFYVGNRLSRAWFPFAAADIESVYALKHGTGHLTIFLLIALIIAPAEELYWRGFLQHHLAERFSPALSLAVTALLYAAVHLPAGNTMLAIAALVGGVFWGALYAWRRSLVANIVSHVAWDLAVFVFWPFLS